jgi:hypothetical protein
VHWSDLPAFHQKMIDEFKKQHAHILPFGYYRGAWYRNTLLMGEAFVSGNELSEPDQNPSRAETVFGIDARSRT